MRRVWGGLAAGDRARPRPLLIGLFVVAGLVTETLAWGSGYVAGEAYPAVFHPQLGVDLIIGVGFYGALGIGWAVLSRWFRFSVAGVFWIAALYGVLFEQDGAVFVQILSALETNPGGSLMMILYVAAVYGAFSALPFALIADGKLAPIRTIPGLLAWLRVPLSFTMCVISPKIGVLIIGSAAMALGLMPEPRSALEHPFW